MPHAREAEHLCCMKISQEFATVKATVVQGTCVTSDHCEGRQKENCAWTYTGKSTPPSVVAACCAKAPAHSSFTIPTSLASQKPGVYAR